MIGMATQLNGQWQWVELTKEETEEAISKCMNWNKRISDIIYTEEEYYNKSELFDKCGVQLYTVLYDKLKKKIHELKEEDSKKKEEKVKNWEQKKGKNVNKVVDEKLGE